MPLVKVTAPQGALSNKDRDSLMSRLSSAVIKAEGADVNDPAAQALVWAHYFELPSGACYVGGEYLDEQPLVISMTTPEGGLNEVKRNELVKEAGSIVDEIIGPFEDRLNHWTMLYEVDEGSWGGAGQVFHLAGIQAAMNIKI